MLILFWHPSLQKREPGPGVPIWFGGLGGHRSLCQDDLPICFRSLASMQMESMLRALIFQIQTDWEGQLQKRNITICSIQLFKCKEVNLQYKGCRRLFPSWAASLAMMTSVGDDVGSNSWKDWNTRPELAFWNLRVPAASICISNWW